MLNGLYVATSGLAMQDRRVNVISNNLANLDTAGFKRELATFTEYRPNVEEHPQNMITSSLYNDTMNSTVKLSEIATDFSEGELKETNKPTDFALANKNAFFVVDTPFGIRYTRAGQFTVNEFNQLVTPEGYNVLGNINEGAQPVVMPDAEENDFIVTKEGAILVDGVAVDNIGTAQFEDTSVLQKSGRNLYAAIDAIPEQAVAPGMVNGYVEHSNVNPIMEMVRMVEATRGFESYQKVVQAVDQLNNTAVNKVGTLT